MERKESWLRLLKANVNDRGFEAATYLVVIRALVSSGGTCSGFSQKSKEWISALKRHHSGSGEKTL